MNRLLWVSLLLIYALPCSAQTPNPFVGTWTGKWQGNVRAQESRLQITPDGGSWKVFDKNKRDPCVGLEAPIAFISQTETDATITLKFSQALSGCPDRNVSFSLTSPTTMSGKFGNADITFTKEK